MGSETSESLSQNQALTGSREHSWSSSLPRGRQHHLSPDLVSILTGLYSPNSLTCCCQVLSSLGKIPTVENFGVSFFSIKLNPNTSLQSASSSEALEFLSQAFPCLHRPLTCPRCNLFILCQLKMWQLFFFIFSVADGFLSLFARLFCFVLVVVVVMGFLFVLF